MNGMNFTVWMVHLVFFSFVFALAQRSARIWHMVNNYYVVVFFLAKCQLAHCLCLWMVNVNDMMCHTRCICLVFYDFWCCCCWLDPLATFQIQIRLTRFILSLVFGLIQFQYLLNVLSLLLILVILLLFFFKFFLSITFVVYAIYFCLSFTERV